MALFHPDVDWKRVRNHTPHGALMAVAGLHLPWIIAACGVVVFLFYEKNEDRHTKDQAWKDVLGFLIGFFAIAIVALAAKLVVFIIAFLK